MYYLNTSTRKRKHIVTLPFEARCTASAYGYVCVGGEYNGHFAVIKLEDSRTVDVDVAVPIDNWTTSHRTPRCGSIKVERIGEHIVNSISIHKIQDEEAHLYDIVAVLTNNDATVRLYSLLHGTETNVIGLPDPMNHATLSPDGRTLVAVGDINHVFFFGRTMLQDPPSIPKPNNRLDMRAVEWESMACLELYIPGPNTQKGYFTTAWSPRGHLLAVGSEAGYITVFDIERFYDPNRDAETEPLVVIPSSRPNIQAHTYPGAVRSMLFSPEPWDLLIWAEDQGRICVGDLRTALNVKQIVELDPKDTALERYDIDDLESEEDLHDTRRLLQLEEEYNQRRLQRGEDENMTGGPSQDSGRNYATEDPSLLDNDPNGLTVHEQMVLESLRTARQREEALSSDQPTSVNYTSATLFNQLRRDLGSNRIHRTQQSPTTSLTGTDIHPRQRLLLRDLSRSSSRYTSNFDPDRATNDYMLPPLSALNRLQASSQQANSTGDPQTEVRLSSNRNASSSTQRQSNRDQDEGPWRIISDAMNLARGPLFDNATSERDRAAADRERERDRDALLTGQHIRALNQQRDRLRSLQRSLDPQRFAAMETGTSTSVGTGANATTQRMATAAATRYPTAAATAGAQQEPSGFEVGWELLRRRSQRRPAGLTAFSGTEIGVRTAGLAVSRDGRTVWAATEEGVFEIGLNLKSRSCWPAVEMR